MARHFAIVTSLLLLAVGLIHAEDRNTKVHNDRETVQQTGLWIYNDLPKGIAEAEKTGRPMLVVFR
jgi:serine protease Do